MSKKLLCGVKRQPTNDQEAVIICNLFALPKMSLQELRENYKFTSEIPEVKYNSKLADEADLANEAGGLIERITNL